jgi:hypothetical protein
MVSLTPRRVRIAYGLALEAGGLLHAMDVIDQLLDDDDKEKFSDYFADVVFGDFLTMFNRARIDVVAAYGWQDIADKNLLKTPPKSDQTIRNYYDTVFAKSLPCNGGAAGKGGRP